MKDPKILGAVRYCILCDAMATTISGHVVDKKGNHYLAGWCEAHEKDVRRPGFMGAYRPKMGKRSDL